MVAYTAPTRTGTLTLKLRDFWGHQVIIQLMPFGDTWQLVSAWTDLLMGNLGHKQKPKRRFRQPSELGPHLTNAQERAMAGPVKPVQDGYGQSIDPKILVSLSPEQLRYVIWEVTPDWFKPEDKRTLKEIAEELGVPTKTLYYWRGMPHVVRAFASFGMYVVKSGIADRQVFENLVELTKTDTKAQEIYWKLRGALTDHGPAPVEFNGLTIDARQIHVDSLDALERFHKQLEPSSANL